MSDKEKIIEDTKQAIHLMDDIIDSLEKRGMLDEDAREVRKLLWQIKEEVQGLSA